MGKVISLFTNGKGDERMPVSIYDVANSFLALESMSHKKLQKLCYYTQAWHLALLGEPLFDERFEAWVHGPVCANLYNDYRDFGWVDIPQRTDFPNSIKNDDDKYEFIHEIYRIYGRLDGDELESLTHSEKPWIEARKELKPWQASHNIINEHTMREFYLDEFENSQND